MKIVLLLVAMSLAGCTGSLRSTRPAEIYDFGPPAQRIADDSASQPLLLALEVNAIAALDSHHIDYRLAYDDPLKRRRYADSRWASAPAVLLKQSLRQQLGFVRETGGIAADCLVYVELQEFSHVFDSPQDSRGVLHGQFGLVDGKRRLLASQAVSIEQRASSPDAPGGVRALAQSSRELGRIVASWLARHGKELQACKAGH